MASYETPEVGLPNNDVLLLRDAKAEAVLPELIDDGAKNLLYWSIDSLKAANPNIISSAWNGNVLTCAGSVTITFNADGTCTLNGTSSSGQTVYFTQSFDLPQGNYVWSAGTLQASGQIELWSGIIDSNSSEHNYTVPNNYIELTGITPKKATIYIEPGLTFSNKVLYPMLCKKAEWDVSQSFEKYALPNPTLTTAAIKTVDEGAKNKMPYTLVSLKSINTEGTWNGNAYTHNGITFTVNSDMTITANGTLSGASAMIRLFTNTPNTFGGMWLSGSPSVSGCSIRIEKSVSPWSTIAADTGNGATVTPDTASNVYAYAQTTVSVSNITFKPMICTKNDWLISKNYTPPAMTNAELTAKTIKFVDVDCYLNNLVFTRSYGSNGSNGAWYTTANDSVSVPGLSTIYSVTICGWESLTYTDVVQPYITANGTKIAFISNTDSFRAATYLKIRAIGI